MLDLDLLLGLISRQDLFGQPLGVAQKLVALKDLITGFRRLQNYKRVFQFNLGAGQHRLAIRRVKILIFHPVAIHVRPAQADLFTGALQSTAVRNHVQDLLA